MALPALAIPPTTSPDGATIAEDSGPTVIDLTSNDSDPDGVGLDLTTLAPADPPGGTAVVNAPGGTPNGTITYTPDENFNGTDNFSYTICDLSAECSVGAVSVTVTSVNDLPVITLLGATPVQVGTGSTYGPAQDSGATAFDVEDLDITDDINVTGLPVDTATIGNKTVTYNVQDSDGGNAVPVQRTVTVVDDDAPVITLNPPSTVTLNTGVAYTDPGYTAIDNIDGNITGNVVVTGGPVVTTTAATYTLRYNVSDTAGNAAAEVTRTVNVEDNNAPTITLNGNPTINLAVNDTWTDPGATANDPEEGNISSSIVVVDPVNTAVAGTYVVTYNVQDSSGNAAPQVTRTVIVSDSNSPTITLVGSANITIDVGDSWSDPGATASDPEEGNLTGSIVVGGDTVNPNVAGTYVITYDVSDSSGNAAPQVTRTVIVNAPPVITVTGDNPASVGQGETYVDAGATATDAEDGDLTGSVTDDAATAVDTSTPGDYTVTYSVSDSNGAMDTATRTVTVAPNDPPSITGQATLTTPEETDLTLVIGDFTVTDPDSDPADLSLTVRSGANYTLVGPNTIRPAVDFNGPLTVPVIVSDQFSDSAVFNASVSVTPVNDRPVISGQRTLTTPEDTSISVLITDITITDPDSSNFTLTLGAGANFTVAGAIVTPAENFNGNLNVPVTVTDDSGAPNATSAQSTLVITVDAVNDFPMLNLEIPDQNAVEASQFTLDISTYFSDADGDRLTYSINPGELPASGNITFNGNTGVFSGTPTIDDTRDNDPYIINVTATDGQAGTVPAVDQFNLVIAALDRANVSLDISVTPNPAMVNDQLRWTFNVRNALGQQSAANVDLNGSFIGAVQSANSTSSCTFQPPSGEVTAFNCGVGGIPPGGLTSIVINTDTSDVGDVTVFAIAAGTQTVPIDPNLDDNSNQTAVGVAEVFSNGAVQFLGSTNVISVSAGDIDGDGSNDIVAGTAAGQPIQIYLSGGFRNFMTSPLSIADNNANEGVAVADFDGNGTNDIVVANGGGQADMVYSNDGAGNFSVMATLGSTFATDVAVGDFDNDGDPDIAISAVGPNPVYLGTGNGGFNLHRELGDANSRDVAVGLFDNNNLDDVAFANVGSPSRVWTKNSGGGFTSTDQIDIGDASSVTVGAFGGNARDDLAFGRVPAGIGDVPANAVMINNGSGNFGNPSELLGAAPTDDILAGDVNSDGLTDLVFINASGVHQIWLANGSGFDLHAEQIVDRDSFAGVLTELGFTDVGDPGGVDLAMGGAVQSGIGVFLNDGAGNLGRGDAVPPVLTLNGEATVDVPANTAYVDSGATAEDNIDGDITASIVINNPVNTASVGAYTVTYNVSDFAGNSATQVTRTVNVTPNAGPGGGGGGALSLWALALLGLILFGLHYRRPPPNWIQAMKTAAKGY